jgi:hypothetical protein
MKNASMIKNDHHNNNTFMNSMGKRTQVDPKHNVILKKGSEVESLTATANLSKSLHDMPTLKRMVPHGNVTIKKREFQG